MSALEVYTIVHGFIARLLNRRLQHCHCLISNGNTSREQVHSWFMCPQLSTCYLQHEIYKGICNNWSLSLHDNQKMDAANGNEVETVRKTKML